MPLTLIYRKYFNALLIYDIYILWEGHQTTHHYHTSLLKKLYLQKLSSFLNEIFSKVFLYIVHQHVGHPFTLTDFRKIYFHRITTRRITELEILNNL
jgi:hypothetical protein